jgi:hypothetical protein
MTAPDDRATATAGEPREAQPSTAALLSELADAVGRLLRQQLALLKFELGQQLASIGHGAVALAAGAVIVFSGWCGLLAAATLALCAIVAPWLAALIVALASLALGAGLLYFARRRLGTGSFTLRRTVRSLREDAAWIRERIR